MDGILQILIPVGLVSVVFFAVIGAVWFLGRLSDWLAGLGPNPGTPEFAAKEDEETMCLCPPRITEAEPMDCPFCGEMRLGPPIHDLSDPSNPASPNFYR